MSQRVELALVRFSDIEKAYYFYDPQHPQAIQFAINGNWESWDVGWVKHHTHDPDVKRIAEDAEARLARYSSTYQQSPSTPVPQPVPVRPPPAADSHPIRSTAVEQPPHLQGADSPPVANFSPIRAPTIDSSMSPPSLSALLFSPALHPASTPRSHSGHEETPSSAGEDHFLELPPIRSPALASQHLHALPQSAAVVTSPLVEKVKVATATKTLVPPPKFSPLANTWGQTPDTQRKRKAIALHGLDEGDKEAARDRAVEHDMEYHIGPPRTRRKSGPATYLTEMNMHKAPPASEASYSSDDQTPDSSVGQLSQSASLQLHHNRDVKIILSLDGDGIRGLSQVFLVEALVGAICTKLNANIQPFQIFDLIGGSSMGGLLAVLLSRLRLPAHAAREAFKYIAGEAFLDKKTFFSSFEPRTQPPVPDTKALHDAIKTVVAAELPHPDESLYDSRADSANVFVVSTQVGIGSNKAALLRSYQSRRKVGPEVNDEMPVWQAIKSTIIAPRYMRPRNGINWQPVIEPGLVDHGTAKNNPVRDALFECRKLFNYTNDMIVIVSIGTGRGLDQDRELPEMAKTIRSRKVEAESSSQRFASENAHLMERGWMKYFRFDVTGLQDVPLEEWCHEDRVREKTTTYLAEPVVGTAFHACVDEIASIITAIPRQI